MPQNRRRRAAGSQLAGPAAVMEKRPRRADHPVPARTQSGSLSASRSAVAGSAPAARSRGLRRGSRLPSRASGFGAAPKPARQLAGRGYSPPRCAEEARSRASGRPQRRSHPAAYRDRSPRRHWSANQDIRAERAAPPPAGRNPGSAGNGRADTASPAGLCRSGSAARATASRSASSTRWASFSAILL